MPSPAKQKRIKTFLQTLQTELNEPGTRFTKAWRETRLTELNELLADGRTTRPPTPRRFPTVLLRTLGDAAATELPLDQAAARLGLATPQSLQAALSQSYKLDIPGAARFKRREGVVVVARSAERLGLALQALELAAPVGFGDSDAPDPAFERARRFDPRRHRLER